MYSEETAPIENDAPVREFKIVHDKKRTIKATCAGQVIEALKRAKGNPLTLNQVASRVKGTKVGKELTVNDVKARCRKVLDWYVKDENHWVVKSDEGYSLALVTE